MCSGEEGGEGGGRGKGVAEEKSGPEPHLLPEAPRHNFPSSGMCI